MSAFLTNGQFGLAAPAYFKKNCEISQYVVCKQGLQYEEWLSRRHECEERVSSFREQMKKTCKDLIRCFLDIYCLLT